MDTNEHFANAAEDFCRTLFAVKQVVRSSRGSILPELDGADYLFNFLSCQKVPKKALDSVKMAINFHTAPPEFPGRGSASYALFNALNGGKWEYGVTAHFMEETFDSGKILKAIRFPIMKDDYCDTLFERALNYTLLLFYDVLNGVATKNLRFLDEKWARKATTRKEFEKWMILNMNDSEDINYKKIRALQHNKFPGPYIEIFGERFFLSPRIKEK